MTADLQPLPKFVLGPITLISGELTPNVPYGGPVKNTYIAGLNPATPSNTGRLDGGKRFTSLEEAQKQCSTNTACTGVTKETDNLSGFTTREGNLQPFNNEQISWAKVGNPSSNNLQALPWKITVNTRDWIISKY